MKTREECVNPLWEQVMNTPDFAVRLNDSLSPDKFRDVLSMKEIYDIKRVIITGCGDSYQAGFIASYLADGNIETAMSKGSQTAAQTLSFIGGFRY